MKHTAELKAITQAITELAKLEDTEADELLAFMLLELLSDEMKAHAFCRSCWQATMALCIVIVAWHDRECDATISAPRSFTQPSLN